MAAKGGDASPDTPCVADGHTLRPTLPKDEFLRGRLPLENEEIRAFRRSGAVAGFQKMPF
jgi:hypothetical protein